MSQAAQLGTGGAPIGNQNAVRAKRFRSAVERALAREGKGNFDKGLNKLADKLVSLAKKGESWALREVADRLDGKVAQAVELTGANGGELVIRDASTSLGIARRVAFVLAHGALAKAKGNWGEAALHKAEQPAARAAKGS